MTLSVYDRAKQEGAEEKAIQFATSLLADNMSVEKVVQYTGLSEEKVKELQTKLEQDRNL